MSRRIHFLAPMALVALLSSSVVLFAQGPGPGAPRGRGGELAPGGPVAQLPLRELNLTDSQRQQVRQLTEQFREQTRALMEQLRTAEQARREAMEDTRVDEGRIRSAMQQLAQVQTELAIRQARLRSEIFAMLTADQQQQVEKLRAEREARFKERQERFQQRQQQRGQQRPQA